VIPGEEEKELPIPKSIWHIGGVTRIPAEHWDILIELVHEKLPEYGDLFEKALYLDGDSFDWSMSKTIQFHLVLEKICLILDESKDLTSEKMEGIFEWFENTTYIQMIQTVIAVIGESIKTGESFDSYAS
jgi:hypothetical protein